MTIGILGAGKLGTVLAQLALRAGYTVYIAGSGDPAKIAMSIKYITPGATAVTAREAIKRADIVILALPLSKYRNIPTDVLSGKLVIDSMNYWWEVDGMDPAIAQPPSSSSEMVQNFLPDSRVVKALSHMGYHHLIDEAKPKNTSGRKAIAITGDNMEDNQKVAKFVDDLGFDPTIVGPLALGKLLEPGYALFGANVDKETLLATIKKDRKS